MTSKPSRRKRWTIARPMSPAAPVTRIVPLGNCSSCSAAFSQDRSPGDARHDLPGWIVDRQDAVDRPEPAKYIEPLRQGLDPAKRNAARQSLGMEDRVRDC